MLRNMKVDKCDGVRTNSMIDRFFMFVWMTVYIHQNISEPFTLWFQLIDMPQGIEQITVQSKDTKVYAMGASKVVFIKGAPIIVSKLRIDPFKRHTTYFQKCTPKDMTQIFEHVRF